MKQLSEPYILDLEALQRPLIAISIAASFDHTRADRPPVPRGNVVPASAKLVAIALSWGCLRNSSTRKRGEPEVVRSLVVADSIQPASGQPIFSSESTLLAEAHFVLGEFVHPILVTWNGYDTQFLRNRGLAEGMAVSWLGTSEGPGYDYSKSGSPATDVRNLLSPHESTIPLEQALADLGLLLPAHMTAGERLELLAVGTFVLVAHRMWRDDKLLDDGDIERALGTFSDRLMTEARRRPPLRAFVPGIKRICDLGRR